MQMNSQMTEKPVYIVLFIWNMIIIDKQPPNIWKKG